MEARVRGDGAGEVLMLVVPLRVVRESLRFVYRPQNGGDSHAPCTAQSLSGRGQRVYGVVTPISGGTTAMNILRPLLVRYFEGRLGRTS